MDNWTFTQFPKVNFTWWQVDAAEILSSPTTARPFDLDHWKKPVPAGVRSKPAGELSNGARLCLKGQSQQLRHGGRVGMNPNPVGLRTWCGWVSDHSRATFHHFGSHPSRTS